MTMEDKHGDRSNMGEGLTEGPTDDYSETGEQTIKMDGGRDSLTEELEQIRLISQPTRANIIQNILGHRFMMPSLKEIDYYNPSKSLGTLSGHLDKLIDSGIVRRLTLPQGDRARDRPSTYFVLSDEGYQLLERHALFFPSLREIREDHASVEKTDQIEQFELALRPTADVEYAHPLRGDGITTVNPAERLESESSDRSRGRESNNNEGGRDSDQSSYELVTGTPGSR